MFIDVQTKEAKVGYLHTLLVYSFSADRLYNSSNIRIHQVRTMCVNTVP